GHLDPGDDNAVAIAQPGGLQDAFAIEKRAIETSQVDEPELGVLNMNDGVLSRGLGAIDDDIAIRLAANAANSLQLHPLPLPGLDPRVPSKLEGFAHGIELANEARDRQ